MGEPERPAEIRHLTLERVGRVQQVLFAPHLLDEHIGGHDPADPQQQGDKQCPGSAPPERDRLAIAPDLQRPKDGEVHVRGG